MAGSECNDPGYYRLQSLRDERLQDVALDRQPQAGHRGQPRTVSSDRDCDLVRVNVAARCRDAGYAASGSHDPDDLAVLDDVDASVACGARVTPRDCVVADRAAAPLKQAALYGKPRRLEIQKGIESSYRFGVDQFGIDAMDAHGVAPPGIGVALRIGVIEVEHPALADHGVVVEVPLKSFPQTQRQFVKGNISRQQVVRPDDRGIASDVSTAEPSFLENGDVLHSVLVREIKCRCEAVSTAADDDHVVSVPRRGVTPLRPPAPMAREGICDKRSQ